MKVEHQATDRWETPGAAERQSGRQTGSVEHDGSGAPERPSTTAALRLSAGMTQRWNDPIDELSAGEEDRRYGQLLEQPGRNVQSKRATERARK